MYRGLHLTHTNNLEQTETSSYPPTIFTPNTTTFLGHQFQAVAYTTRMTLGLANISDM